ncbi:MAG: hypothetical protein QOK29_3503 [Rhodospirillaceae bacterium]|nr:hypothetical protein [Rhodospirillaceae bacterium]
MRLDVLGIVVAAVLILAWLYRRDRERYRRLRGGFFADCLDLFQTYRVVQDDVDFPVLEGRYRGFDVRLEPIVDHITFRKIPSLWLKVTLLAPVAYTGVFDLLVRPRGSEFYSPIGDLEHRVPMPSGWPEDAEIRSDDPAGMPPIDRIAPHIRLFNDPRLKELLITPRGVRLVYQAQQAERAHYAVLRQIEFAEHRLPHGLARRLMEAVLEIHDSVTSMSPRIS